MLGTRLLRTVGDERKLGVGSDKVLELGFVRGSKLVEAQNVFLAAPIAETAEPVFDAMVHAQFCQAGGPVHLQDVNGVWHAGTSGRGRPVDETLEFERGDLIASEIVVW